MQKELKKKHKDIIKKIKIFLDEYNFYLAGGTALFYYFYHRESDDLDFFTDKKFDFEKHGLLFKKSKILYRDENTVHMILNNIKISFFYYPYKKLKKLKIFDSIKLAGLIDILCMKINEIIGKYCKKDFFDVYFILNELQISPQKCINFFIKKYGQYNPLIIYKAMIFFDDADKESELKLYIKIKWEDVKKFFINQFGKLAFNHLR